MGLGEGYAMFFCFFVFALVEMRNLSGHCVLEIKCLIWNSVKDM